MATPIYNIQSNNKEISGLINFTRQGPNNIPHGTINAPYSIQFSGEPSSASSYEILRDEMISNLESLLLSTYGINTKLNVVTPVKLTVNINGGTGQLSEITGNYNVGDKIILSITPDNDFTFSKWLVGNNEISNQQSFEYTITKDTVITCELLPILFTVNVNSVQGQIKINGNIINEDEFPKGETIKISSNVNSGYTLESWKINDSIIGTSNPLSYVITDNDVTINAIYIEDEPSEETEENQEQPPVEQPEPYEPLPPPEPATFEYLPTNNIIVRPDIEVDTIEIEADEDSEENVNIFLSKIGSSIPLIKIDDYVLNSGDIIHFKLNFRLNSIPTFTLTVNDDKYYIREALKNDIDKCTIFIGYKIWYIKFNGILNTTISEAGDAIIDLTGELYNQKLYETKQFVYSDISIKDILTEVCTDTSMGLYVIDNPDLNKTVPHLVENCNNIGFLKKTIKNYTKNVFMFDCFYYLHVVDIDKLRECELDKYNLDWRTQREYDSPAELKFSTKSYKDDNSDETIIPITFYSIDTNYTKIFLESNSIYEVGVGGSEEKLVHHTNENFGIGKKSTNTFFGFKDQKFPFYEEIVNTKLGGNIIKIHLDYAIFELIPFSIVDVELFLPKNSFEEEKFDEEHSGKKIVIGYSLNYDQPIDTNSENSITQTIELI